MTYARVIDFAPLERLLSLAGAKGAPAIFAALLDDLKTTEAQLDQAWNGPDFAALRTNSHVLVGLAGTVGDTALHALAQKLNLDARAQKPSDVVDSMEDIMTGLSNLITQLQTKAGA